MFQLGHNKKILLERRRELRKRQTDAETRLWNCLRHRRFLGLKFCRQYSVDPYILDFYCHAAALAVELDGNQHAAPEQQAYDLERSEVLKECGIRVLRFWNHEVMKDLSMVLDAIRTIVQDSPPSPLSFREGDRI